MKLKHPIVLVHGLGARGKMGPFSYFYGLPKLLERQGIPYLVADLTAWQSSPHRAEHLKEQILQKFPETKVNLLGHSMGGIDARYLTSALGFSEHVASVTTVGTPNRGSHLGDLIQRSPIQKLLHATESIAQLLLKASHEGFHQMSRENTERLNAKMPDVSGVKYLCAMSVIKRPVMKNSLPLFWIPHKILEESEGENDGFVSLESATWGELITKIDGDHYAQIGQPLGFARGTDYLGFYRTILEHLERSGL